MTRDGQLLVLLVIYQYHQIHQYQRRLSLLLFSAILSGISDVGAIGMGCSLRLGNIWTGLKATQNIFEDNYYKSQICLIYLYSQEHDGIELNILVNNKV